MVRSDQPGQTFNGSPQRLQIQHNVAGGDHVGGSKLKHGADGEHVSHVLGREHGHDRAAIWLVRHEALGLQQAQCLSRSIS